MPPATPGQKIPEQAMSMGEGRSPAALSVADEPFPLPENSHYIKAIGKAFPAQSNSVISPQSPPNLPCARPKTLTHRIAGICVPNAGLISSPQADRTNHPLETRASQVPLNFPYVLLPSDRRHRRERDPLCCTRPFFAPATPAT